MCEEEERCVIEGKENKWIGNLWVRESREIMEEESEGVSTG